MSNALRHPPGPAAALYLAGPTAVGKSAVALWLAEHRGGEIISVDSMQVYRGLDVGTAKPTQAERARVRHHLIDVVDLTGSFDAARFRQLAAEAVEDLRARGRVAIFCGGTGLYFKAWMEGLSTAPPSDPACRAELEQIPLPRLLEELRDRDPLTFERIDRCNPRRVIRALEVIRLTGQPFSAVQAPWQAGGSGRPPVPGFFYLSREAADLQARIAARVEAMFQAGWVEETREALEHGLQQNPFAMQAIGYREIIEHLQGKLPLRQAMDQVLIRTRQFAKRQATWFRKHAAATAVLMSPGQSVEAVGRELLARQAASATPP